MFFSQILKTLLITLTLILNFDRLVLIQCNIGIFKGGFSQNSVITVNPQFYNPHTMNILHITKDINRYGKTHDKLHSHYR